MRRLAVMFLLVFASAWAPRVHATPEISPRTRLVMRGSLDARRIGIDDDRRALVLVRVAGGAALLSRAGFQAHYVSGELAAVRADREELRALAALPEVERIEERQLLYPLLDAAGPAVRAPQARAETGLSGNGVLAAVIDTGIDFRHADLRNADGTSRLVALLDVSQPGEPGTPGKVFLKSDLDAVLAAEKAGTPPPITITQRDTNGHGTHVASIIGSSGLATDKGLPQGRYLGVAPGVDLIGVHAARGRDFNASDVLASCRWVVDFAAKLGRPLVVNLSLGGTGGPHDGSSVLEQELDAIFPPDVPGRALVLAAGNDGARDYHAALWSLDGEAVLPLSVPMTSALSGVVNLEIWYRGSVVLSVEGPSGALAGMAAPGETTAGIPGRDGRAIIDNASNGPRPDGRSGVSLVLEGPMGSAAAAGVWKVRVSGSASRFDAWIIEAPSSGTRFTDHISVDDLLSVPATARHPIVVGAFVSKPNWLTVDGQMVMRKITDGSISSFSASGPTIDGRFAPDLVAPGEFVGAAISADAPPTSPGSQFFVPGNPNFAVLDDGLHGALRGTSQAAPMVAGAVALLFEADPTLTSSAVRELLRASASAGSSGFSPRAGFGKLDVLAALRLLRGMRGAAVSAATSAVGASRDALPPGGEPLLLTVTPRDAAGQPLGPGHAVDVWATAGVPAGATSDLGAGRYQRAWWLDAPRGTTARIDAVVDGVPLDAHPQVHVVRDRSEIGQPFVARGGCQASPLSEGTAALGALIVVCLALLARTLGKIRARVRRTVR
jgi:subtilisin family serine protease